MPFRLNKALLDTPIVSGQGKFQNSCETCSLKDICVKGCCSQHSNCVQKICYQNCDDCGGGPPLRYQGGNVSAVCSKAPLKDLQLMDVKRDEYMFKKRKRIKLKKPAVIITQGSPGRIEGRPYPDDCEAVAVNLRHVWSNRGWFSRDLKDYMRMSSSMKLILLTATHDDVLERAYEKEVHLDDFASLGIDHWQCIDFSEYSDMSRFYNLWTSYRCLHTHEQSKAHFGLLPPLTHMNNDNTDMLAPWIACAKACPQVMHNCQFVGINDPTVFRKMIANMKRALSAVRHIKSLWFIGIVSGSEAYNLQLNFPQHDCYFLSVNPWLAAFKGDLLTAGGKLKKSDLPRRELAVQNQLNYQTIIQQAVNAAREHSRGG